MSLYVLIYSININGFLSKTESFKSIISMLNPSVILQSETLFKYNKRMNIPGYASFTRNINSKGGGGVASSVRESEASKCLRPRSGRGSNEYIITRHSQFSVPLNIINVYGAQECRTSREEIVRHWEELMAEVTQIETKGEALVMAGDMNCLVGDIVIGNDRKISSIAQSS